MRKFCICVLLFLSAIVCTNANTKETVTLKKCVDGDTARFVLDGEDTSVRFLAVNAPEYTKEKQPYGKEASELVCTLLSEANTIELEYDDGSDKRDKYDRVLAWVYVDGVRVQDELVKQGLAEVKYLYGDYAYTDVLQDLEKNAKQQQLNMWSDGEGETKGDVKTWITTGVTGVICILAGMFFTKNKRDKKRLIKKGIRTFTKK